MLRTNLKTDSAADRWAKYMQLTEAGASFRALKSELSIRPLFHQKEPRVKAHVMVAFLGYALWVTLKHRLAVEPLVPPNEADNSKRFYSPMTALCAVYTAKRRHRSTHYRWPRNPSTPHHRTDRRAAATTRPPGLQPPSAFSIQSKSSADFRIAWTDSKRLTRLPSITVTNLG